MSDSVKYIKYNGGVEASAFTKTNGTADDVLLADGTTIAISDLLSDYYTKDEADELHTSVIKIKGTLGGKAGSISTLPTDAEVGDAYIVGSDPEPSYEGHSVESGDIFVWIKRGDRGYWTVIQSNWTASSGSSDLSWGSNTTLATVGGVNINAKLPTNPVDDLEIGGVNLLPNTRTGVGFTFQPLSTGCSGEFDSTNKWFKFTCPQNAVTTNLADTILLKSPTVLLTPGTYTVSCLYQCTLPLNRMQVWCLPVTSEGSYDNALSFAFEIKSSNPVTYFKKYSATFNISEDLRDVYGWIIRIDLDHRGSHSSSQELYVKDIKLEKGHKATDWTPTLSEITPDSGYLRLSGGKMSGDILPDNHTPALGRDFAMEPGVTPPTYRSLGSENSYFNKIYAREFKGLANNALQLYTYKDGNLTYITPIAVNKGNKATPVYFKDGVPVACNSIPTSDTVASWGYVTSSGITKLNVGAGLQGKANNDDPVDAITTSVGTITLKTASQNEIGGIKLGYSTNGKNYPVNVNTAGQAYVNVPWTDNNVTQSVSTSNGAYPLLCKLDTDNNSTTNSVKFVSGVTVNPSTGAVNAQAFYETSDIRKKEIKSDLSLDKCYDLIDKCQTVIYSLKDLTKELVGMIAQEIEEFFPEVVATDEEGFKSLAYDRLVVICFKVLKDVIKRLEKLES